MRRDSIFYRIFKQSPALIFELLETVPTNAADYKFDSVAVKEPKFEIDGVFLPPDTEDSGVVYFCEVQFQKDEQLYERLFGEAFLYFYRNRDRYSDWQAVVIYPSRNLEQTNAHPYRALLSSDQVHRVYLDEVGEIRQLPLGIALMVLTTVDQVQAPEEARYLLARAQQEGQSATVSRAIMEIVTTIMVYKFEQMSRVEVEAMLGLTLQETRVYQEAKAEGREEGERIGEERGEQRGQQKGAASLVVRLLTQRLDQELSAGMQTDKSAIARSRVEALPLPQLEALTEILLDFTSLDDLLTWLEANHPAEGGDAPEVSD